MNIEDFRSYCLSLKGSKEEMPFVNAKSEYDKDLLVFSVLDKWFCLANITVFDCCILKCNPEYSIELQEQYIGIKPGYHMNKKHWINVYLNSDISDDMIKTLINNSYNEVINTFTKKQQEEWKLI